MTATGFRHCYKSSSQALSQGARAARSSQHFAHAERLPREVAGTIPACQGQHQMPSAVTIILGEMWRVFWASQSFLWLPALRQILSWQGEQEKPRGSSAHVNSLLFLSAENSVLINTPMKFPGCATVFSLVSFQAPLLQEIYKTSQRLGKRLQSLKLHTINKSGFFICTLQWYLSTCLSEQYKLNLVKLLVASYLPK